MLACSAGDSINASTYAALHSTIDTDGLFDILEMQEVHNSWKHAAMANQAHDG